MFRRLASGLPKDPVFPVGLDALGYFVNEIDEVRSKQNPRAYFNYFLTKNERYNEVQKESMNESLRQIVLTRLADLGLETIRLPLTAGPEDPHIPILISANIEKASRVVVVFTDHIQDLGVFAYRVVGGAKGINAGSAIDLVKYLQTQISSPTDSSPPGIILANTGQLRWWRKGKKAISQASWFALPKKSAVGKDLRFDAEKNTVEGNRDTREHVAYILGEVVPKIVTNPKASINIIGLSDSCTQIVDFLDKKENWARLGERLGGMALLAPHFCGEDVTNEEFADYLKCRARAYVSSYHDNNMPICGSAGNKHHQGLMAPTYALSPPVVSESLLPLNYKTLLDWFLEVEEGGEEYSNPQMFEFGADEEEEEEVEENVEIDDEWKGAA